MLNDYFTSLVRKLDLPAGRTDGLVFHSLWHFFETICVNYSIPQRVIDTWMEHRSDRSMAAVHYRLSDDESQSFMKLVPFGTGHAGANARKEAER